MKFNISYPATGMQKLVEMDDERKLRMFYDKRMAHEVEGEALGDDFKGYVFKIAGGNDKQGFPMMQGVITSQRVRILFKKGMPCYRERTAGARKRKSVRGCIVGPELSVLNLVVIKKGEQEIQGLTDQTKPRRLGPKRASRIRKLFNLDKEDDVRQYVIRRQIVRDGKKPRTKAPKIQRLITPQRLQRKRHLKAVKRQRYEASKKLAEEYNALVAQRSAEAKKAAKARSASKKRSASKREESKNEEAPKQAEPEKKQEKAPEKKTDKKADKKADKKTDKKTDKKADKKAEKPQEKKQEKAPEKKPQEKPQEKKAEKADDKSKKAKKADKPADKPVEKPQEKPQEKKSDKGAEKKSDKSSKKKGQK